MAVTQYMNQFGQLPLKGQVSLIVNPNTISVQLYLSSTETLYAGDFVKLYSATSNCIVVEKCAQADTPIGVVIYSPKKDAWTAGQMLEIALPGSIVNVQAGAAINRGVDLQYTPSTSKVATNAGVYPIIGTALDAAAADGDIIRAYIKGSIALVATISSGSINNCPIGQTTPNLGTFTTLKATANVGGAVIALGTTGTQSLNPAIGNVFTITPAGNIVINAASVPATGQIVNLVVTTSGTSVCTITFNTNFKSTGVLSTGATTGKVFVVTFVSDGTNLNEVSRTTAQ